MFKTAISALAVTLALGAATAEAADDVSTLTIAGGVFDVRRPEFRTFEGRLEYRHGRGWWILKPFAGVMANADSAVYGYIGVYADFLLTDHLYVQPSFAPGLYHRGDSYDLGGPIEFRSQLEVGWRFNDGARVGLAFSHMSNASIYDQNGGVESATVNVSLPLNW